MKFLTLITVVVSTVVLSSGFAYDDDRNSDLTKERFGRDLSKQKFAFAFAKRGPDALEEKLRFTRDLDNTKKFAFAKRSPEMNDEERLQRFTRELDNNKKFAFAFAKRFAAIDHDEPFLRFARPSFA